MKSIIAAFFAIILTFGANAAPVNDLGSEPEIKSVPVQPFKQIMRTNICGTYEMFSKYLEQNKLTQRMLLSYGIPNPVTKEITKEYIMYMTDEKFKGAWAFIEIDTAQSPQSWCVLASGYGLSSGNPLIRHYLGHYEQES